MFRWVLMIGLLGVGSVALGAESMYNNEPLTGKAPVHNPGKLCSSKEVFKVLTFKPLGMNKIVNGSFEMGLDPFSTCPAYSVINRAYDSATAYAYKTPPPLPRVVSDVKHDGSKSLRIDVSTTHQNPVLYVTAPDISGLSPDTTCYISFWAKATRTLCVKCAGRHWIGSEWRKITAKFNLNSNNKRKIPGMTLVFSTGNAPKDDIGKPYTVWVDDIRWSFNKPAKESISGPVEATFVPISRQGYVIAGKRYSLTWKLKSPKTRMVTTTLYLRDISRNAQTRKLPSRRRTLTAGNIVTGGTEPLAIKSGHYLALLAVRDYKTGKLLAVARQRFSILHNLLTLPRTVDYDSGAMYWFNPPSAYPVRGPWSIDEQYKITALCGGFVLRKIGVWGNVEQLEGKYNWGKLDFEMAAAAKYRVGHLQDLLGQPFGLPGAKMEKFINGKDDGRYWRLKRARLRGKETVVLDHTWVPDFKGYKFWFAPLDVQERFIRLYFERYGTKGTSGIEYRNEVNAFVQPNEYIEKVMKPLYPIFKECAPDIPVVTCNTGSAGTSYLKKLGELGGFKYMDGFTTHPYQHPTLQSGSLKDMRMIRKAADEFGGKDFIIGNSECLTFPPIETVEHTLSDWVAGGRWSCGKAWLGLFAIENNGNRSWHDTGPMTPSLRGVYLNGFNYVLAGAKLLGSIESFDDVLVGFFEKDIPSQGQKEYVVALAAAMKNNKSALLENIDLSGISFVAYDETGEPRPATMVHSADNSVFVPHRVAYLISSNPEIIKAFKNASRRWVFDAGYKSYELNRMDGAFDNAMQIYYGNMTFNQECRLTEWQVSASDTISSFPPSTNIFKADPASGNLRIGQIPDGY